MNGAFSFSHPHTGFTKLEVDQCFALPMIKPLMTKVSNVNGKGVDNEYSERFAISDKSLRNLLKMYMLGSFRILYAE
jgi:hypothetical protein